MKARAFRKEIEKRGTKRGTGWERVKGLLRVSIMDYFPGSLADWVYTVSNKLSDPTNKCTLALRHKLSAPLFVTFYV